jgi:hypothetical protein
MTGSIDRMIGVENDALSYCGINQRHDRRGKIGNVEFVECASRWIERDTQKCEAFYSKTEGSTIEVPKGGDSVVLRGESRDSVSPRKASSFAHLAETQGPGSLSRPNPQGRQTQRTGRRARQRALHPSSGSTKQPRVVRVGWGRSPLVLHLGFRVRAEDRKVEGESQQRWVPSVPT